MKVFISDLHLGDGSKTDDFHRDKEFLKFLEFVQSQAEELIIVGDLLELWQADLDRVLFEHNEVINKLLSLRKKIKVTYIVGNHDYVPFIKFVNSDTDICLEYHDSESGIIAEHGFRYDIFNRYKNPLKAFKWPVGRYFSLSVANLERLAHPDVDEWAKNALINIDKFLHEAMLIRNKVTPATKEYIKKGGHFGEFQKAVNNHIDHGEKIVIFGHTHKSQLQELEKGIYANCGAWVDRATPTYIACHKERIELKEGLTHKTIKELPLFLK